MSTTCTRSKTAYVEIPIPVLPPLYREGAESESGMDSQNHGTEAGIMESMNQPGDPKNSPERQIAMLRRGLFSGGVLAAVVIFISLYSHHRTLVIVVPLVFLAIDLPTCYLILRSIRKKLSNNSSDTWQM